jgi:hypothetical protein
MDCIDVECMGDFIKESSDLQCYTHLFSFTFWEDDVIRFPDSCNYSIINLEEVFINAEDVQIPVEYVMCVNLKEIETGSTLRMSVDEFVDMIDYEDVTIVLNMGH